MKNQDWYLGLDWGGTRVKLGALTPDATFIAQDTFESPHNVRIANAVEALLDRTAGLIENVGSLPLGMGLGLTGPVDPELGVVLLPGKVKGLEKYPIVPQFKERFAVPVRAQNDGTLSMYAEKYAGKAKGVDWAVSLTIGTGIGSGVLLDGRILEDPNFMFGTQLGHLVINAADDQLCLTGARGTAEMSCSATALSLAVRSGLQRGIPSVLTESYFTDAHAIDFHTIIKEGVEREDRLCLDELRRWTSKLGWLLVNAVHAYSPQVIILSGGAMLAASHFLPDLRQHVNRYIFRHPPGQGVPIVVSEISEHTGVLGAAMMIKRHLESSK